MFNKKKKNTKTKLVGGILAATIVTLGGAIYGNKKTNFVEKGIETAKGFLTKSEEVE